MRFTAIVFLATLGYFGATPAGAESWEKVNGVFQEHCVMCHAGEGAPLGLQLDSHALAMKGSENGPVIFPGDPGKSPLIHRLTGKAEPRMPLTGPPYLEDEVIAMISAWIKSGASGPMTAAAPQPTPERPADPRADGQITYSEVAPIFGKHCVECHSAASKLGAPPEGLKLGTREDILRGGGRIVLIPGNAQASEIIRRVEGLAQPRMPLDGPPWLSAGEIALLRDWIDGGARADDGSPAPVPAGGTVRLRGVLTAANEVDGARFHMTPSTRLKHVPAPGGHAELRGVIAPDGRIIAVRLRGR